jgi:hypothetical protein
MLWGFDGAPESITHGSMATGGSELQHACVETIPSLKRPEQATGTPLGSNRTENRTADILAVVVMASSLLHRTMAFRAIGSTRLITARSCKSLPDRNPTSIEHIR